MTQKVLIVEDTGSIAMVFQSWLKRAGIESDHVADGASALTALNSGKHNVVLLDLQLPDMNGMDILKTVREQGIAATVIVVTSSGSINTAIDAMRAGAYDFLVKPAAEERLVTTVKNAIERDDLKVAVSTIKANFGGGGKHGFIGSSLPMIAIYKIIDAVGPSSASVFITGESGTGKELCAEALHKSGPRKNAAFVALNCAAIPKDLIESEIFGHTKGAFTGATTDRDGAALAASGGTLFLDEICEMDLALQSKLLRFLQTGTVQKVGSDRTTPVDVRIVCATNRDPLEEVEAGRFREDLYYRLHVVPIHLPPLRERSDDCIKIAEQLLTQMNERENRSFAGFSADALDALLSHDWPGNVRELQNVIHNAVVVNDGNEITADMLTIAPRPGGNRSGTLRPGGGSRTVNPEFRMEVDIDRSFDSIERDIIETAINKCGGSIPKAAALLQLSPSTIYRKKESWS